MGKTKVTVKTIVLPTYEEAPAEKLPMFAENRVHQRFTGNPYPNAVVIKTPAKEKHDKEYTAIVLENDYIELTMLPDIGGKIFTAVDKTTGYDFFYRQHVIKPALIGMLGSWISGGIEFNWPYHHRASTMLPCDWEIVEDESGITVWMSEHEPVDRMKGMFGIYLASDRAIFETRMKVSNRTSMRHSFLWWENTAVPVNPSYEIFFPADVDHVHFHYRRSNTTYPIAHGHFNGYTFDEPGVDISKHFNTKFPTSYFCAASDYDYFGGYDQSKQCGVVHIADHHISIGKKMFTWAYNQLSRSWERALTDDDGPYAELMAGTYTNNQPDLTWLEPYETKCFKQSWFPLGALGVPSYANFDAAVRVEDGLLRIQPTGDFPAQRITLTKDGKEIFSTVCDLKAGKVARFDLPAFDASTYTVRVGDILEYTQIVREQKPLPPLFPEVPMPKELHTAEELYVAALHFWQYRDPNANPETYLCRAIELEPNFAPALQMLGEIYIRRHEYARAKEMLDRAFAALTVYNFHPESGKLNYLRGVAAAGLGMDKEAYDLFRNAAWMEDAISAAMTRASMLDSKRGDYESAKYCADIALEHNVQNLAAAVWSAAADYKLGNLAEARGKLRAELVRDPLNHLARRFCVVLGDMSEDEFFDKLHSDKCETCLDIGIDMLEAGYTDEAMAMFYALPKYTENLAPAVCYMIGREDLISENHRTFPHYPLEGRILAEHGANYYLGCYHYGDRRYAEAKALFAKGDDYASLRCLAMCEYRDGNTQAALELLDRAHAARPQMEQIVYEIAYLLNHTGAEPNGAAKKIADMVPDLATTRDDIATEWAHALNRASRHDEALAILAGHNFVPCEGGETALARQYLNAWYGKGMQALERGDDDAAMTAFENAQVLPENLGAGLWHFAPLVPAKYQQALLFEKRGEKEKAFEIYKFFNYLYVDYFSNMNLPLLPVYQALGNIRMGNVAEAKAQLEKAIADWTFERDREDSGYYGTTPFFIVYMDDAKKARYADYQARIDTAKAVLDGTSPLLLKK